MPLLSFRYLSDGDRGYSACQLYRLWHRYLEFGHRGPVCVQLYGVRPWLLQRGNRGYISRNLYLVRWGHVQCGYDCLVHRHLHTLPDRPVLCHGGHSTCPLHRPAWQLQLDQHGNKCHQLPMGV